MPRQVSAPAGRFVHEHSAKAGNGGVGAISSGAQVAEEGLLHIAQVQGVEFQLCDLAVAEGGALVPSGLRSHVSEDAALGIQLHHHTAVVEGSPAQHDGVDPLQESGQFTFLDCATEAQIAFGTKGLPFSIGDGVPHESPALSVLLPSR